MGASSSAPVPHGERARRVGLFSSLDSHGLLFEPLLREPYGSLVSVVKRPGLGCHVRLDSDGRVVVIGDPACVRGLKHVPAAPDSATAESKGGGPLEAGGMVYARVCDRWLKGKVVKVERPSVLACERYNSVVSALRRLAEETSCLEFDDAIASLLDQSRAAEQPWDADDLAQRARGIINGANAKAALSRPPAFKFGTQSAGARLDVVTGNRACANGGFAIAAALYRARKTTAGLGLSAEQSRELKRLKLALNELTSMPADPLPGSAVLAQRGEGVDAPYVHGTVAVAKTPRDTVALLFEEHDVGLAKAVRRPLVHFDHLSRAQLLERGGLDASDGATVLPGERVYACVPRGYRESGVGEIEDDERKNLDEQRAELQRFQAGVRERESRTTGNCPWTQGRSELAEHETRFHMVQDACAVSAFEEPTRVGHVLEVAPAAGSLREQTYGVLYEDGTVEKGITQRDVTCDGDMVWMDGVFDARSPNLMEVRLDRNGGPASGGLLGKTLLFSQGNGVHVAEVVQSVRGTKPFEHGPKDGQDAANLDQDVEQRHGHVESIARWIITFKPALPVPADKARAFGQRKVGGGGGAGGQPAFRSGAVNIKSSIPIRSRLQSLGGGHVEYPGQVCQVNDGTYDLELEDGQARDATARDDIWLGEDVESQAAKFKLPVRSRVLARPFAVPAGGVGALQAPEVDATFQGCHLQVVIPSCKSSAGGEPFTVHVGLDVAPSPDTHPDLLLLGSDSTIESLKEQIEEWAERRPETSEAYPLVEGMDQMQAVLGAHTLDDRRALASYGIGGDPSNEDLSNEGGPSRACIWLVPKSPTWFAGTVAARRLSPGQPTTVGAGSFFYDVQPDDARQPLLRGLCRAELNSLSRPVVEQGAYVTLVCHGVLRADAEPAFRGPGAEQGSSQWDQRSEIELLGQCFADGASCRTDVARWQLQPKTSEEAAALADGEDGGAAAVRRIQMRARVVRAYRTKFGTSTADETEGGLDDRDELPVAYDVVFPTGEALTGLRRHCLRAQPPDLSLPPDADVYVRGLPRYYRGEIQSGPSGALRRTMYSPISGAQSESTETVAVTFRHGLEDPNVPLAAVRFMKPQLGVALQSTDVAEVLRTPEDKQALLTQREGELQAVLEKGSQGPEADQALKSAEEQVRQAEAALGTFELLFKEDDESVDGFQADDVWVEPALMMRECMSPARLVRGTSVLVRPGGPVDGKFKFYAGRVASLEDDSLVEDGQVTYTVQVDGNGPCLHTIARSDIRVLAVPGAAAQPLPLQKGMEVVAQQRTQVWAAARQLAPPLPAKIVKAYTPFGTCGVRYADGETTMDVPRQSIRTVGSGSLVLVRSSGTALRSQPRLAESAFRLGYVVDVVRDDGADSTLGDLLSPGVLVSKAFKAVDGLPYLSELAMAVDVWEPGRGSEGQGAAEAPHLITVRGQESDVAELFRQLQLSAACRPEWDGDVRQPLTAQVDPGHWAAASTGPAGAPGPAEEAAWASDWVHKTGLRLQYVPHFTLETAEAAAAAQTARSEVWVYNADEATSFNAMCSKVKEDLPRAIYGVRGHLGSTPAAAGPGVGSGLARQWCRSVGMDPSLEFVVVDGSRPSSADEGMAALAAIVHSRSRQVRTLADGLSSSVYPVGLPSAQQWADPANSVRAPRSGTLAYAPKLSAARVMRENDGTFNVLFGDGARHMSVPRRRLRCASTTVDYMGLRELALQCRQGVEELDVSYNDVGGPQGWEALRLMLARLGPDEIAANSWLESAIKIDQVGTRWGGFSTLQKLSLRGMRLGEGGAQVVAAALKNNGVLTDLDLSANAIGDAGAAHVAMVLPLHPSLTRLNLGDNNIGSDGARSLAASLCQFYPAVVTDVHATHDVLLNEPLESEGGQEAGQHPQWRLRVPGSEMSAFVEGARVLARKTPGRRGGSGESGTAADGPPYRPAVIQRVTYPRSSREQGGDEPRYTVLYESGEAASAELRSCPVCKRMESAYHDCGRKGRELDLLATYGRGTKVEVFTGLKWARPAGAGASAGSSGSMPGNAEQNRGRGGREAEEEEEWVQVLKVLRHVPRDSVRHFASEAVGAWEWWERRHVFANAGTAGEDPMGEYNGEDFHVFDPVAVKGQSGEEDRPGTVLQLHPDGTLDVRLDDVGEGPKGGWERLQNHRVGHLRTPGPGEPFLIRQYKAGRVVRSSQSFDVVYDLSGPVEHPGRPAPPVYARAVREARRAQELELEPLPLVDKALSRSELRSLNGWYVGKGQPVEARLTRQPCVLADLVLDGNDLGDVLKTRGTGDPAGLRALVEAAVARTTITSLSLARVPVGDVAIFHLARALADVQRNRSLTSLDLTSTEVSENGVLDLLAMLGINDCLQSLVLSNNAINWSGPWTRGKHRLGDRWDPHSKLLKSTANQSQLLRDYWAGQQGQRLRGWIRDSLQSLTPLQKATLKKKQAEEARQQEEAEDAASNKSPREAAAEAAIRIGKEAAEAQKHAELCQANVEADELEEADKAANRAQTHKEVAEGFYRKALQAQQRAKTKYENGGDAKDYEGTTAEVAQGKVSYERAKASCSVARELADKLRAQNGNQDWGSDEEGLEREDDEPEEGEEGTPADKTGVAALMNDPRVCLVRAGSVAGCLVHGRIRLTQDPEIAVDIEAPISGQRCFTLDDITAVNVDDTATRWALKARMRDHEWLRARCPDNHYIQIQALAAGGAGEAELTLLPENEWDYFEWSESLLGSVRGRNRGFHRLGWPLAYTAEDEATRDEEQQKSDRRLLHPDASTTVNTAWVDVDALPVPLQQPQTEATEATRQLLLERRDARKKPEGNRLMEAMKTDLAPTLQKHFLDEQLVEAVEDRLLLLPVPTNRLRQHCNFRGWMRRKAESGGEETEEGESKERGTEGEAAAHGSLEAARTAVEAGNAVIRDQLAKQRRAEQQQPRRFYAMYKSSMLYEFSSEADFEAFFPAVEGPPVLRSSHYPTQSWDLETLTCVKAKWDPELYLFKSLGFPIAATNRMHGLVPGEPDLSRKDLLDRVSLRSTLATFAREASLEGLECEAPQSKLFRALAQELPDRDPANAGPRRLIAPYLSSNRIRNMDQLWAAIQFAKGVSGESTRVFRQHEFECACGCDPAGHVDVGAVAKEMRKLAAGCSSFITKYRFQTDRSMFLSCYPKKEEDLQARRRNWPRNASPGPERGFIEWRVFEKAEVVEGKPEASKQATKHVATCWVDYEAIRSQLDGHFDRLLGSRTAADTGSAFLAWAQRTATSEEVGEALREYGQALDTTETDTEPPRVRRKGQVELSSAAYEELAELCLDLTPSALDDSRIKTSRA